MFPRRAIETLLTSNLSFIVEAAKTINFTTLFANSKQLLTLRPEIFAVLLFLAGIPRLRTFNQLFCLLLASTRQGIKVQPCCNNIHVSSN